MSVLVWVEHNNTELSPATLHAVTAAFQIDASVDLIVVGSGCEGVAEQATKIDGAGKVLCVNDPVYEHVVAENAALLLAAVGKDYGHVLAAATTEGKNILPRAAALLDVAPISDISAVLSPDTFERPIYAGNAIATVQSSDPIRFITIRATSFEAAQTGAGSATIESSESRGDAGVATYLGAEVSSSERPELTSARVVVSGGRGMQNGENFKLLEPLADRLTAAIGASRAAVDAGFVPNEYQVGQTGKVVAPDLYMAFGISGAIQHLAGMKDSKVIVAVNKDEEAPIFQVADYGIVGDLFDVIPELEKALEEAG